MSPVRLSILIPVYNEANYIKALLERVVTAPASYFHAKRLVVEVIVVDDGSQDGSCQEVEKFAQAHPVAAVRLIRHTVNRGKGAAVCTAIEHAESEFCLIQDADLEYDPVDYPQLLEPLLSGEADVVLGSRFLNPPQRRPMRYWQAIANRLITAITGMAAGLEISDAETGYKGFRTKLGRTVPLNSMRFGLDPELIVQFAKRHARFVEVPISYRGRSLEQGKKIRAVDVFSAIGSILRARFFTAAHVDPAADMLVAMSRAKRFNQWMADVIAPWVVGDVLELGAGIGNLTLPLSAGRRQYMATDTDEEHLSELLSRAACSPNVKLGLCDFSDTNDVARFYQIADTVICLNSLEHVDDDMAALSNIYSCLRPGGTAIILVPQGPQAFGSFDEILQHKRRYTRLELHRKMAASGFQLTQIIDFNHVAWPGWYLNSRVFRRRSLSRIQLRLFDLLVPIWRRIDGALPWPPTSLIAIGTAIPNG